MDQQLMYLIQPNTIFCCCSQIAQRPDVESRIIKHLYIDLTYSGIVPILLKI